MAKFADMIKRLIAALDIEKGLIAALGGASAAQDKDGPQ